MIAVLVASGVIWGCADGSTGAVNLPDSSSVLDVLDAADAEGDALDSSSEDTSSDDDTDGEPDGEPDVTDDGLAVCVLNAGGPTGECVDPAVLDFGVVDPGATETRLFRIDNVGSLDATVWTVDIVADEFSTEIVTFDDAGDNRTVVSLPQQLAPGASLYFEVTLVAGTTAGVLPANEVVVNVAVGGTAPQTLIVAMSGQLGGCFAGTADCDGDASNGCEVDTTADLAHCGGCGTACDTANAEVACNAGACEFVACLEGFADCNDDLEVDGCEQDIATSTEHCGGCGVLCESDNASVTCEAGLCKLANCAAGYDDCDQNPDNGCEQDILTSNLHCGACEATCSISNAEAFCDAGSCTFSACDAGRESCDGDTENGCEIDILGDELNCGACATACTNDHGSTLCNNGLCTPSCDALWGNCDNDPVNGCEQQLNTVSDCGGCGVTCDRANAGESCTNGTCELGACEPGYGNCDNVGATGCETDLQTEVLNCGACGNTCSNAHGSTSCSAGSCQPVCDPGWSDCDGDPDNGCETNINTLTHCGACGVSCGHANAASSCATGVCTMGACDTYFDDCNASDADGCEIDTRTDTSHCGTCGNVCSNAAGGTTCAGGACSPQCDPLWASCDGDATNGCEQQLNTLDDCGACGVTCDRANAAESCTSGTCELGACDAGFGNCDANGNTGCETDLQTELLNCGACGNTCSNAHGSTSCSAGACQPVCDPGWSDCDGDPDNGCETNINSLTSCGACGVSCGHPNAASSCASGTCTLTVCDTNFADCNGSTADGCEVNTQISTANCGACNNVCTNANGNTTCSSGVCSPVCDPLWGNCDGDLTDGCEQPLTTLGHCGGCGISCSHPNASSSCSSGSCQLGTCNAGYASCDGNATTGCETHTNTSTANCGACGNTCTNAHGSTSCSAGSCQPVCEPGWSDCDGDPDNGCETNIQTLSNCGGCGLTCGHANAASSCSTGVCTMGACAADFADCNGSTADGCEINTNTSTAHCGACGASCTNTHGSTSCASGACVPQCDPQWASCDGDPTNGCEQSLTTLSNCGGCGITCDRANAAESCSSGTCQLGTCDAGYASCDGNATTGCETHTNTSTANCGACGNTCTNAHGSTSCSAGACQPVCDPGWSDCDGDPDNGCETNIRTLSNCGGCGVSCGHPNATSSCASGTCSMVACNTDFANCNGSTADGCEINTNTSTANCGACNNVCTNTHGSTTCSSGVCTPSCDPLWGSCDGNSSNGCEQSLATLSNCGGCNVVCDYVNASESCSSGTCTFGGCSAGWGNCDNDVLTGCEQDITSTVAHCGACGNDCSRPNTDFSCTNSACVFNGCTNGYQDLNNDLSDGCEYLCTPTGGIDVPDDGFVDADCDGIDGDASDAIFVATNGTDLAAGTMAAPKATLANAILTAAAEGKDVYVSEGTYTGSISTSNGVSVYGGYSRAAGWARSNAYQVVINGGTSAVTCVNDDDVTLDRLTINAQSNTSTGGSSYGVRLSGCDNFKLHRSTVTAGAAGNGSTGSSGTQGGDGNPGGVGQQGCEDSSGTCASCSRPSAGGGGGGCGGGNNGGGGGRPGHENSNGDYGTIGATAGGILNGVGGTGGYGGCCSRSSNGNCTNGSCTCMGSADGFNGGIGDAGDPGQVGTGGTAGASFNTNSTGSYTPANGGFGGTGGRGGGGGGGGGGHGGAEWCDSYGSGGGGGGGGACGGTGGTGGSGAGGSFAVWVYNSQNVTVTSTTLNTGNGGTGGTGGSGGGGGTGGQGGAGGPYNGNGEQDDGGCGGRGGNGGNGGTGGQGGGGGGGPSIGIVFNSCTSCSQTGNSFSLGSGGSGGSGGNTGNAGRNQNVYTL